MMPEYLFEPSQINDANTVSFNYNGNPDYGFSDLGLPLEFALLFEDISSDTKPNIQNHSLERFLPMTNNQFHFSHQQNNHFDNSRFNDYPSNDLNFPERLDHANNDNFDFHQSLRIPMTIHEDQNQRMSFPCAPELESVFSDSTTNTPVLQNTNFQFPDQFETAFQHKEDVVQVKRMKKGNFTNTSKKHKRKNIMARSRTGCWICRIKHLKCDESRPCCNNCSRFGIQCDFSDIRPSYVLDSNLRREKLDSITTKKRRRASD